MVLVVAEKPSVGRDIARVLGATSRGKNYLSGNGYAVTWCIGHLIRLAMPDEIDPALKAWNLATLPILPPDIPLAVIGAVKEQFETVKMLINDKNISEIVNAGDAGRAGEYIQRLVYIMAGNKKPVKRLWISA
jgi:Topoisomerase IA